MSSSRLAGRYEEENATLKKGGETLTASNAKAFEQLNAAEALNDDLRQKFQTSQGELKNYRKRNASLVEENCELLVQVRAQDGPRGGRRPLRLRSGARQSL